MFKLNTINIYSSKFNSFIINNIRYIITDNETESFGRCFLIFNVFSITIGFNHILNFLNVIFNPHYFELLIKNQNNHLTKYNVTFTFKDFVKLIFLSSLHGSK